MDDELLTPRQVADRLGVTVRTVQRWIADGRLPATRIGGRLRVSRSSLAAVAGEPGAVLVHPIHRLLVANRGEIVERVARTARRLGIWTIGLVAPDDRPPVATDEVLRVSSYLAADEIVAAAVHVGADAVHPGYGFLSENAAFAASVERAGLAWVGPPEAAMAAMGDKAAARRVAAGVGVPVLPGYDGPEQDDPALTGAAEELGLPILVKPAAGGGGKGMRVVRRAEDLAEALAAARREAGRAFGDERLILERLLDGPRHVEVQVLFDGHGNAVHLGERDCSAQRRSQKILEETPGPAVTPELRSRMGDAALRVGSAVGYVGAGTVEFLLADDGAFYFLEMNTRLQVEHPVTEAVAGRDLVADQLRIAAGEMLGFDQAGVRLAGHAIEARLYAEDPDAGFLPADGRIAHLRWPEGVRVDAGVRAGDLVGDRYDPMLAKVVAHGPDRAQALQRLRTALTETEILGVRTNLRFLRWLLDQPAVVDGQMRTDTVERLQLPDPVAPDDAAWRSAAEAAAGLLADGPWGGGWRLNAGRTVRLRCGPDERRVEVPAGDVHGGPVAVDRAAGSIHLDVDGQSLDFRLAPPPTVEEAARQAGAHGAEHASLVAPMPGRVVAIRATEGTSVLAHEPVIVIEAMKMEHAVVAPLAGTVVRVMVTEGQQVQRGDVLAEVSA